MNYSQKIKNNGKDIARLRRSFVEVKDRLEILRRINLRGDYHLGMSISYIVNDVIATIDTIESIVDLPELPTI